MIFKLINKRVGGKPGRGSRVLHVADRTIGIPLIFFSGLLKKKRALPLNIERVCFFKSTAIGDTIILSAAIKTFRNRYPNAELTICVGPSNHEAAKLLDNVDQIICLPVKNPLKSIQIIRQHQFDILVDFGSWPRLDAIYANFAKAKYVIGFANENQYRHYLHDMAINHKVDVHESINYQRLLQAIGCENISIPEMSDSKGVPPGFDIPNSLVVIHMWPGGSQAKAKVWPETNWMKLIDSLISTGSPIGLTGSADDRTKNDEFIASYNKSHHHTNELLNFAGTSLKETVWILSHAKFVVSVDTGILHISSALNVPTIGLYGPTHSERWGGLGSNTISLNATSLAEAAIQLGFEKPRGETMGTITVEAVKAAISQLHVSR